MASAPPWAVHLDQGPRGPKSTLANVVAVLQHDPDYRPEVLWFDTFLQRVQFANSPVREWRDDDDTRLTVYCQQEVKLGTVSEAVVSSAVRYVARQRERHCVRDYLASVVWDGVPRLETAFERYWGAVPGPEQPAAYLRAASANFFIGLVARVEEPGCQLDNMVVFEGAQGVGKSRALRVLGGPWYLLAAESVASKDFFQCLPGAWLVEIGELDAFSRAERERVKSAISTPRDRYRASYARHASDHARQCVFAGTTNRDDWGNDDTGLRRFWPVTCGVVDIPALTADRDLLFAEAQLDYVNGHHWWETPPDATLAVQRGRQHEDAWTATVLEWVQGRPEVPITDVLIGALKFRESEIGRGEQLRVGSILRLAGWRKKVVRRGGTLLKAWIPPDDDVTVV